MSKLNDNLERFLFVSLVTNRVSHEEVCLPSFDVLNCWLNVEASCLDDENELPLKVIASLSASCFAPPIPFKVIHSMVTSVFWSKVSTKAIYFCTFVYVDTVLDVLIQSWQFKQGGVSFTEVISSCHQPSISAGRCSSCSRCRLVGMWYNAALSRTVRKIPSLWQYVGRDRLLRAASTSCLYLSQLAFFRLT